jgi:hypothetical protein
LFSWVRDTGIRGLIWAYEPFGAILIPKPHKGKQEGTLWSSRAVLYGVEVMNTWFIAFVKTHIAAHIVWSPGRNSQGFWDPKSLCNLFVLL